MILMNKNKQKLRPHDPHPPKNKPTHKACKQELSVVSDNSRSLSVGENAHTQTHKLNISISTALDATFRIMHTDLCHLLARKHEKNVHARELAHSHAQILPTMY